MKGRCRDPDAPGHRGVYIRQHHSMLPLLGSIHEIQNIRSTAHERRLPAKADLIDRKITLSLSDEAKAWLGRVSYDLVYGARPLKRAIQRYFVGPAGRNPLARQHPRWRHGDGERGRSGVGVDKSMKQS